MFRKPRPDPVCSFCHKPQDDVAALLAGPGVMICDTCVLLCAHLCKEKGIAPFTRFEFPSFESNPSPPGPGPTR